MTIFAHVYIFYQYKDKQKCGCLVRSVCPNFCCLLKSYRAAIKLLLFQ